MSCKKTSYLWHLCTTFITEHLNCSVCKTRAIITTPSDPFNSFLPTSLYLLEWEWELCLHSVFLHKMHHVYPRGLKTHIYVLSYLFVKQFFFFFKVWNLPSSLRLFAGTWSPPSISVVVWMCILCCPSRAQDKNNVDPDWYIRKTPQRIPVSWYLHSTDVLKPRCVMIRSEDAANILWED